MPPKKKISKNQEDDELDKQFEKKQALLMKVEEENKDESSATGKANIFENIKQVDTQQQKKKKNQKEQEKEDEVKQSKDKKKKQEKQVKAGSEKREEAESKGEEQEQEKEDIKQVFKQFEEGCECCENGSDQEGEQQEEEAEEEEHSHSNEQSDSQKQREKKDKKKKTESDKKEKSDEKKSQKKANQQQEHDQELFKDKISEENACDSRIVIFIFGALILMFTFKYFGDNYNRYNYSSGQGNLYEFLEIESSATQSEIKAAYRKLSSIWHPDKNPNCGDVCKEKFYSITEAWKILGNPKQRENYDSTNGVLEIIKSKAITLNGANYNSLVLQSTDVWVIQVYMNGHNGCKRMAPFWESIIDKYGHVVKFGRIDAEKEIRLVQNLPFASSIFPTIFTTSHHSPPTMIVFSTHDVEAELVKQVQKAVLNKIVIVKKDNAAQFAQQINEYKPNKRIDIVYLFQSDRIPIDFKYSALQNSHEFNFYTNGYGQLSTVQSALKTKNNFLVFMNDEKNQTRIKHEFNFGSTFNTEKYDKIMGYLNFKVTPQLSKENFKHFCKKQQVAQEYSATAVDDEQEEDSRDYQTLCILLFSNSPLHNDLLKQIEQFRSEKEVENINRFTKGERIFENYHNIQFAIVDLNIHWRLRQVFEKFLNDPKHNHQTKQLHALAYLDENKKVSLLKSLNEFEDWVLDLEDQSIEFEYFTEYLSSDSDISSLLQFSYDTPLRMLGKSLLANAIDFKTIITVILGFITLLVKYNALFAAKCTTSLFFIAVALLSVYENYQEFIYTQ